MESGALAFTPPHSNELQFLRSRVRELERERAELSAENQRLKTMLVNGEYDTSSPAANHSALFYSALLGFAEIPGLLSTMWQTLGQTNGLPSVAVAKSDTYGPYSHQQQAANHDAELRPLVYGQQLQEELSGDMFESWGPLGSEEEELSVGAELGLGSHMGEEAPLCSQTNMEELRRSCSESQCTAASGHVSSTSNIETTSCLNRKWLFRLFPVEGDGAEPAVLVSR